MLESSYSVLAKIKKVAQRRYRRLTIHDHEMEIFSENQNLKPVDEWK